jgi:hypothetical protein
MRDERGTIRHEKNKCAKNRVRPNQGNNMPTDVDDGFYSRADAHINLSNDQLKDIGRGKVSASMMYALARFNAFITACRFQSAEQLSEAREETIEYFTAQYRKMLEENLDDHIAQFDKYMKPGQ